MSQAIFTNITTYNSDNTIKGGLIYAVNNSIVEISSSEFSTIYNME